MSCLIACVDAFASHAFAGNPAAVCLLDAPADSDRMQRVAAEMNLAETAFVAPDDGGLRLRWFTPIVEVDLCGHATLAAAHILWSVGGRSRDERIRFLTRSGELEARWRGNLIELDFPAEPAVPLAPADALRTSLSVPLLWTGRNRMDWMVEVASESTLRSLKPDLVGLSSIDARGIIVTCRSERAEFDFVSRFFAPRVGIPEDPVTGSAHCCLGPFWAERLGRRNLTGFQASARGGTVRVTTAGSRVHLGGEAVTIYTGQLLAP